VILATTADIASAMIFLSLLEGFRRVPDESFVITRWRGRWRKHSSPASVWFRRLRWLWLVPLQFRPRTYVCGFAPPTAAAKPQTPNRVLEAIEGHRNRWHSLGVVSSGQVVLIFFLLPIAATASPVWAYSVLIMILMFAAAIAALSWRGLRWTVFKYVAYPPSSLFAVADHTLDALREPSCDAIALALFDGADRDAFLRRYYRTAIFGAGQSDTDSQAVRRQAERLLAPYGLRLADFLGDPVRSYAASRSYCPCCETEFVIEDGECVDCSHVRLVPFKI
jgi:hypothetical protein